MTSPSPIRDFGDNNYDSGAPRMSTTMTSSFSRRIELYIEYESTKNINDNILYEYGTAFIVDRYGMPVCFTLYSHFMVE